jgi:hypothetical protein
MARQNGEGFVIGTGINTTRVYIGWGGAIKIEDSDNDEVVELTIDKLRSILSWYDNEPAKVVAPTFKFCQCNTSICECGLRSG